MDHSTDDLATWSRESLIEEVLALEAERRATRRLVRDLDRHFRLGQVNCDEATQRIEAFFQPDFNPDGAVRLVAS